MANIDDCLDSVQLFRINFVVVSLPWYLAPQMKNSYACGKGSFGDRMAHQLPGGPSYLSLFSSFVIETGANMS